MTTTIAAQPTTTQPKLWTVQDYYRMSDLGILNPEERTELIDGEIFLMAAKNPPHSAITKTISDYLRDLIRGKADIRIQEPVHLSDRSEPELDIALVRIESRNYVERHPIPEEIFLIIEVADTTLNFERNRKAANYARAGIADYWIVDVNGGRIFVFRRPSGEKYLEKTVFEKDGVLTPLAFPDISICGSQFFP